MEQLEWRRSGDPSGDFKRKASLSVCGGAVRTENLVTRTFVRGRRASHKLKDGEKSGDAFGWVGFEWDLRGGGQGGRVLYSGECTEYVCIPVLKANFIRPPMCFQVPSDDVPQSNLPDSALLPGGEELREKNDEPLLRKRTTDDGASPWEKSKMNKSCLSSWFRYVQVRMMTLQTSSVMMMMMMMIMFILRAKLMGKLSSNVGCSAEAQRGREDRRKKRCRPPGAV